MLNNIRIEIADKDKTVWTDDDELVRAIKKCVALMSRLTPYRTMIERTLTDDDIVDDYLIDMSDFLTNYIKIERVEYDTDLGLPTPVTFDVIGDYLKLRTDQGLAADKVLRIIYLRDWTAPTDSADGTYPIHLDDVVIIGSAGQALIFKAAEYTHKVITTLDSGLTVLGAISAITFPTAPTISSYLTDADTALDAAIARFAAAVTTLGSMDTPLGDANTALDAAITELSTAVGYLDTGDDLINAATRGEKAGSVYGEYAAHGTNVASGYIEEAKQRIALALGYEQDSARDTTIGNSYINEAIQRLTIAAREIDKYAGEVDSAGHEVSYYRAQIDKATMYGSLAASYLEAAGRYLADGQSKINEFLAALGIKPEYPRQKASGEQTSF